MLMFCFVTALAIVSLGPGDPAVLMAVIALTVSMAVLLFNSTMLFGSHGGAKVLTVARVLLWVSFLLITLAIVLCIGSMVGSLL